MDLLSVFLSLLLGISLGLRPQEIPLGSPASPWKTQSLPPLFLSLIHFSSDSDAIIVLVVDGWWSRVEVADGWKRPFFCILELQGPMAPLF